MSGLDLDEPLHSSTPDTTASLLMAPLMAVRQPWPPTGRGTASHRRSGVDMARNMDTEPDHPRERVIANEADLRAALAARLLENWDAGDPAANDELIRRLGEWHRRRRAS